MLDNYDFKPEAYQTAAHSIIKVAGGKPTFDNIQKVSTLLAYQALVHHKAGADNAFNTLKTEINKPSKEEQQALEAINVARTIFEI